MNEIFVWRKLPAIRYVTVGSIIDLIITVIHFIFVKKLSVKTLLENDFRTNQMNKNNLHENNFMGTGH